MSTDIGLGAVEIGSVVWRHRVVVHGRIRSMRVQPFGGAATLECTLVDDSGGILLVFYGRKRIAGLDLGRSLTAEGVAAEHRGYLALLNPWYRLDDHVG